MEVAAGAVVTGGVGFPAVLLRGWGCRLFAAAPPPPSARLLPREAGLVAVAAATAAAGAGSMIGIEGRLFMTSCFTGGSGCFAGIFGGDFGF